MINDMVSIITACYNGERFIENYVRSVLSQTYDSIEIIFINDGSTDNSAEQIKKHAGEFTQRGIVLKYFYQKNQGQAAATNVGLSHMTGEYFCLFDIDDLLEPDCIEERVRFLKEHPQCGLVRSNVWRISEDQPDKRMHFLNKETTEEAWIFDDLVDNKINAFPIFYLYSTAAFYKIFPDMQIYNSRYTQDVQLVLPLAYHYKCGFIKKCLGTYLCHDDSHSHKYNSVEERLELWRGWEKVWLYTVENINTGRHIRDIYLTKIKKRFLNIKQFLLLELLWNNIDNDIISSRNYAIFGSGDEGKILANMLLKKKLNLDCFIDNDICRHGMRLYDKKIVGLDEFKTKFSQDTLILVASDKYKSEMIAQLKANRFDEGQYIYYKKFIFQFIGDCMEWN